jgi:protein TonB
LASTSAFELDAEPAPPPDPAEAALLEYMPDSAGAPSNPSPQPAATSGTKEYPWQPVSKPLSEPMASSLRRAAETAGTVGKPAAAPRSSEVTRDVKRSADLASGLSSLGAAAAPARAKEAAHTAAKLFESNLGEISAPAPQKLAEESEHFVAKASSATAEAPIFSSLDDPEEGSEGQSVKKRVLFLAVAAAVIVTGYFGWTKMHPGNETPAVQQQQQVAPASFPVNSQAASSNQEEITLSTKSQSNSSEEGEATGSAPERVASSSSAKPSAGKSSAAIAATASAPAPNVVEPAQTPEPLVVTNQSPKQAPSASTPAEAVQAPALDAVASNNGDKAISGMLSAAPVSVPTQAPHTARISQGISQGLLVKRIAPMYPPTAKQMHVQGTVQLEANISKDGNITGVKQLSGDTTLGRAATEAVRQWKYKPYVLNGEPIEIQTQITVIFKLP